MNRITPSRTTIQYFSGICYRMYSNPESYTVEDMVNHINAVIPFVLNMFDDDFYCALRTKDAKEILDIAIEGAKLANEEYVENSQSYRERIINYIAKKMITMLYMATSLLDVSELVIKPYYSVVCAIRKKVYDERWSEARTITEFCDILAEFWSCYGKVVEECDVQAPILIIGPQIPDALNHKVDLTKAMIKTVYDLTIYTADAFDLMIKEMIDTVKDIKRTAVKYYTMYYDDPKSAPLEPTEFGDSYSCTTKD